MMVKKAVDSILCYEGDLLSISRKKVHSKSQGGRSISRKKHVGVLACMRLRALRSPPIVAKRLRSVALRL